MTELYCDRSVACGSKLSDANEKLVIQRARVRGWRIYDGISMTGKPITVVLCNKCLKEPLTRSEPVLEGQEPLWTENA